MNTPLTIIVILLIIVYILLLITKDKWYIFLPRLILTVLVIILITIYTYKDGIKDTSINILKGNPNKYHIEVLKTYNNDSIINIDTIYVKNN